MENVSVQGESVPALGFGTWRLTGRECAEAVEDALSIGYRHLDTAQVYDNEEEVGRALDRSGVARDQVFLTTKVWVDAFGHDALVRSTDQSLKKLGVDHVDLLLLHWPNLDVPLSETLGALVEVQQAGKTRHIGVSNFTPTLVETAAGYGTIFSNQVEFHPFLDQPKLTEQARRMDYLLTAYCPTARGAVNDDATLREIAEAHGKTPVQVSLRWLVQQEKVAAIPKAGSHKHRVENFQIFDFRLSDDEMRRIHQLNAEHRIVDPGWAPEWER